MNPRIVDPQISQIDAHKATIINLRESVSSADEKGVDEKEGTYGG